MNDEELDEAMRHIISVKDLRDLLTQLRDDDELEPNTVANLRILRAGVSVGYIDLLKGQSAVNFWSDATDE
jgi:hypothetical protein